MIGTRAAVALLLALLRRPDLWLTAIRQLFLLAPKGWWKQSPPLPLPDKKYLAFRMETQYGRPDADPVPADVIDYLQWCRRQPHLAK